MFRLTCAAGFGSAGLGYGFVAWVQGNDGMGSEEEFGYGKTNFVLLKRTEQTGWKNITPQTLGRSGNVRTLGPGIGRSKDYGVAPQIVPLR